jgi:hypothetical protein
MTDRSILLARKKITACKKKDQNLEALLRLLHLNKALMHFILESCMQNLNLKEKKTKQVLELLSLEMTRNSQLRMLLSSRNSKPVKQWFKQMDLFVKALKIKIPNNTNNLLLNGEAVFTILHISAKKATLQR